MILLPLNSVSQQSLCTYCVDCVGTPPINSTIAAAIDQFYEMRLETLLSVDDLVAAVIKALEVLTKELITNEL